MFMNVTTTIKTEDEQLAEFLRTLAAAEDNEIYTGLEGLEEE